MKSSLQNKQILLGVTGGIAAYKSADLIRRLREAGAQVQVVMTQNAQQFITPLTLQALSGNPVRSELFDPAAEAAMGHIELARWADVILVAPASAGFMERLAAGRADDLLSTLCLATTAPIVIAPAMNQKMWENTVTQNNLQELRQQKVKIWGPAAGSQACGEVGPGRMLEPAELLEKLEGLFDTGALAGLNLLITAGPTHEAIDPVRFISNASSGKMGYALAEAAVEAGAVVTLISGPVNLNTPRHCKKKAVVSAQEMLEAVEAEIETTDIFLAVAAVADYRCKAIASQKITKQNASLHLELEPTTDIVTTVAQRSQKPFIVGFAVETEEVLAKAAAKRLRKGMDVIIANRVGAGQGFDSDDNEVTVLWADQEQALARAPKTKLARQLIALIATIYRKCALPQNQNPSPAERERVG